MASIDSAGRSSMVVRVYVITEIIRNSNRRHTNHCYFTMVAMVDGKPKTILPYIPETEDENLRDQSTTIRKQLKGEYIEKLALLEEASSP